jgi:hypothetical protein
MMNIGNTDAVKLLKEIAQNENEKFKLFRNKLTEFCMNRKIGVLSVFRILKGLEAEIGECLSCHIRIDVDRVIILKVLKALRTEIDIIRCRMKHPGVFDADDSMIPETVGKWTDDKIDLIELIYAIKMSVDHGNVSIKALQEAFELIFQVKLGNIYDRLGEINDRKGDKARYLKGLVTNLNRILEDLK